MTNEITQHRKIRNMRKLITVNGKESSILSSHDRNLARKTLNCYEYYIWDGIMQLMPYALKDKYPTYKDVVMYSEFFTLIGKNDNAGITYEEYEKGIAGLIEKKYLRLVKGVYECYERPYDKI